MRASSFCALSAPPTQNVRQSRRAVRPSAPARSMNCTIATSSSSASGIMASISAAVARQSVHLASTATGCLMTKTMLVMPSGTTRKLT